MRAYRKSNRQPAAACLFLYVLCTAAAFAQAGAAPDINANYRSPDLNAEEWAQRFEVEGREVFDFRNEIVTAIGIRPGQDIADIGAGTGLFVPLFSAATEPGGTVYAVDVVPAFLEHIRKRAQAAGLANIRTVLGDQFTVNLAPGSVDIVFVCDAYHHFENPADTLSSIRDALRPGGQLVIVEFDKVPGKSSDWILSHIRATREEFTDEIVAQGFRLMDDLTLSGMQETFIRRFGKE